MNVANQITMGRLVASLFLFGVMMALDVPSESAAFWLSVSLVLFLLVVATDALDGYYARKLGQVSAFGRVADPAVDKIVVCGTFVFLVAAPWTRPVIAPWMVVLIISREFLISALRGYVESRGIDFGADATGKLKMVLQCAAIPSVFLFKVVELRWTEVAWAVDGSRWLSISLVWLALLLTVYSGFEYVMKAARLLKSERLT